MMMAGLFLTLVVTAQDAGGGTNWVPYTSQDGNFVVDFPKKPTRTFTRQSRSKAGQVKVVVAQCDTPDILYTAQKVEMPQATGLKPADMEAILDAQGGELANDFNGKVIAQKKLRLDTGAFGRDFTIEGKPVANQGLAAIRVRMYLSQKVLYILIASTAADKDLPDDVGHFFASFSAGTNRTKKVGPHPEVAGKPLGTWGEAIDPDGDCQIAAKGESLEIAIPNTHHDLNADNDKLNAPRVVREVTGDFTITVKVGGGFQPPEKSTNPKAVPYIGGGIVIWQNSDNYIFLGRAAINRKGKVSQFAAFEEREWGTRGALNNKGIDPGDVYLRVERRSNRILGYTSKDGQSWTKLEPMEPSYPSTLKVGLYAINGASAPTTIIFNDFAFTEGKAAPDAKPKAKNKKNLSQIDPERRPRAGSGGDDIAR